MATYFVAHCKLRSKMHQDVYPNIDDEQTTISGRIRIEALSIRELTRKVADQLTVRQDKYDLR